MGSLTSGIGGDDSLQLTIAVFCIVVTLGMTALTPILVTEYDAENADFLEEMRIKMENFTGESMITYSPWYLSDVRTPYRANAQDNVTSTWDWVYGSITEHYELDGTVYLDIPDPTDKDPSNPSNKYSEKIRMDPSQKSAIPLSVSENIPGTKMVDKWYFSGAIGGFAYGVINGISEFFGGGVDRQEERVVSNNAFNFTGLLYHYNATYKISTQGSNATKLNSDYGSLNVVWYDNSYGSGVSGGLILQSDKSKAIIANYEATDIIASVNEDSKYATKYLLNFEGIQVYMYILFDADVITSGSSYYDAWNNGDWQIAFASPSGDGLLDIMNSNNLSSSLGNLLDTYSSIFTFSMPNCPAHWQLVLWVVCILPIEVAPILFVSRFGIVGVGFGILANTLGFLGGMV